MRSRALLLKETEPSTVLGSKGPSGPRREPPRAIALGYFASFGWSLVIDAGAAGTLTTANRGHLAEKHHSASQMIGKERLN